MGGTCLTTPEALWVIQTGPSITLWRMNAWNPPSHSGLEITSPTTSLHHTLQRVCLAKTNVCGVMADSVHAALQHNCTITLMIIFISMITQQIHAGSLNTPNSQGITPIIDYNLKMIQAPPMDLWLSVQPLPGM